MASSALFVFLAACVAGVSSFGAPSPVAFSRHARSLARASRARASRVVCADEGDGSAVATYMDKGKDIPTSAKEKLFLDSIACFYNDEKPLLSDSDYEQLKMDLEFEASKYVTMSRDELKFVIASTRYREGKPIMSDVEYDELRTRLKKANSPAVVHEAPTCKVDTGICKSDAVPDNGKNLVLYIPGTLASTLLVVEALFWLKGFDPLLSTILGSPLIFLLSRLITNKILFQNPLVVSTICPNCSSVINLYFGDVLGVDNTNVMSTEHDCPVCKTKLKGNRETMLVETVVPKA
mmetsp:Transcript_7541/g.25638  ORF Transcript_7541/g.25638 Transcript_7541/m.25638 type:complete len:293 (+) Transcript_7541:29-907(+)